MAQPRVSVIICCYTDQRWNELVNAINSIVDQTTTVAETIIIVDHNPTLLARVRTAFPDLVSAPNAGRQGLSSARNTGIELAQHEIVAFLDDDARASRDWVARLQDGYASERVVGLGGRVTGDWAVPQPDWFPEEFGWVVGCSYTGQPTTRQPVRNMLGANMSFRRHVFAIAGVFDPDLGRVGTVPVGCEETELCIRIRKRLPGHDIIYDPDLTVTHLVTPQRATWAYFRSRCLSEGLSKAMVATLVGQESGLASERTYTLRTLPRGFFRALGQAISQRNPRYVLRAGAIAAGLLITTAGYGKGRLTFARRSRVR